MESSPKRPQPRAERREALLAAARETFARKGLAGTTIRDIAKAANIDHALIYRHFDSKQEIFDAALVQPMERALRGWTEFSQSSSAYVEGGSPERERGAVALERVVRATAEVAPFIGVVLFSEHGPAFYREHLGPAIDEFARGIEAAKSRWEHRDFDADLPAIVVLGAGLLAGLRASFENQEPDFAPFAKDLQELIFDGLRSRKP